MSRDKFRLRRSRWKARMHQMIRALLPKYLCYARLFLFAVLQRSALYCSKLAFHRARGDDRISTPRPEPRHRCVARHLRRASQSQACRGAATGEFHLLQLPAIRLDCSCTGAMTHPARFVTIGLTVPEREACLWCLLTRRVSQMNTSPRNGRRWCFRDTSRICFRA
jgi:hypothetical protein